MNGKSLVNISISKSNLKNDTYYANVCNTGRVSSAELLKMLSQKSAFIDVDMVAFAMKKLEEIVMELALSGHSVEFFSFGTFSLACKGAVKLAGERNAIKKIENFVDAEDGGERAKKDAGGINSKVADIGLKESSKDKKGADNMLDSQNLLGAQNAFKFVEKLDSIEEDGALQSFDITEYMTGSPHFSLKFAMSSAMRATLKKATVRMAIKKRHSPSISTIENIPIKDAKGAQIVRLKGSGLKLSGEREAVGIYIKDEETKRAYKVPKDAILRNAPSELMFIIENKEAMSKMSEIFVATQYVRQGSSCINSHLKVGKRCVFQKKYSHYLQAKE